MCLADTGDLNDVGLDSWHKIMATEIMSFSQVRIKKKKEKYS